MTKTLTLTRNFKSTNTVKPWSTFITHNGNTTVHYFKTRELARLRAKEAVRGNGDLFNPVKTVVCRANSRTARRLSKLVTAEKRHTYFFNSGTRAGKTSDPVIATLQYRAPVALSLNL